MDDDWKMKHCPALITLKLISGKWKTRILWLLRSGPMGFGELRRGLAGVSPKVLTDQLRQLEADGLIYRDQQAVSGIQHMRYGYTSYGESLIPILDAIGKWGAAHGNKN